MDTNNNEMPLVSICCITYNHAPYIRECLDGFVIQQTNFPIEVLIYDDASTDGAQDIIREYEKKFPDIIKPIYQTENQYSKGVKVGATYNYLRAKGKYIALCEGDDYWTDPLKLQKQVDFLEANSEYGMCYTRRIDYIQETNCFLDESSPAVLDNSIDKLLIYNPVPTLTTLSRTDLMMQYLREVKPEIKKWKVGDYPIWLWLTINSKIYGLADTTAVYRVLKDSASHTSDISKKIELSQTFLHIKLEYNHIYNLGLDEKHIKGKEVINNLRLCISMKEYKKGILLLMNSIKTDTFLFFHLSLWKEIAYKLNVTKEA